MPKILLDGHVVPPDARRCIARTQHGRGPRCGNWTLDPRITVCRLHGGAAFDQRTGRWKGRSTNLVTGRYAKAVANIPELEELYQAVLAEDDMQESAEEIALLRAMLSRWLERSGSAVMSGKALPVITQVVDTIDKLVQRRHLRLHGSNLQITVRDWEALLTRVFDIAHEFYGDRPDYPDFVKAIIGMNQPRNSVIIGSAKELSDGEPVLDSAGEAGQSGVWAGDDSGEAAPSE